MRHGACCAGVQGGSCIQTCLQEMEALQKANAELAEKAQAVSSAVRAKQKGVPGSWSYVVLTHEGLLRVFILMTLDVAVVCLSAIELSAKRIARVEMCFVPSLFSPVNRLLHCPAELQALECSLTVEEIAAETEELQSQVDRHPQSCPKSCQLNSA